MLGDNQSPLRLPSNGVVYLHGGGLLDQPSASVLFLKEFLGNLLKGVSVLILPFAAEESSWKEHTNKLYDLLTHSLPISVHLDIASVDPDIAHQQALQSEFAILLGGSEVRFRSITEHWLSKSVQLPPRILGISAGSHILCQHYYSNDRQRIEEGFGLLPYNLICHFTADRSSRRDLLESAFPEVSTIGLADNQWQSIEIKDSEPSLIRSIAKRKEVQ